MYRIPEPRRLGAALREERHNQGITQADLAERARVSRGWLIKFENGHDTAEVSAIFRVMKTLGLVMTLQAAPEPTREERLTQEAFDRLFGD